MIITKKKFNGIYNGENVEKELEEYLERLMTYTKGQPFVPETQKRERIAIPDGYDINMKGKHYKSMHPDMKKRISAFWIEQNRRMKEGFEGMAGLQYGYFNFARHSGGKSRYTEYRRNDNELFNLVEACIYGDNEHFQGYQGWGITEIGRRRSGKTAKVGWMVVHLLRTSWDSYILVTSKTEDDASNVVIGQKVKFMYDKLPLPIKPSQMRTSVKEIHLGKKGRDAAGNSQIQGRNTRAMGFPPKTTSAEGNTLIAWIHDEQGKTKKLGTLFSNTSEALNDAEGFDRDGFIYLTGVAGDFDVHGLDAIHIWNSADEKKLVRWFSPGWVSMNCDEYGNEDIRAGVRRILMERNQIFNNKDLPVEQRQKELREHQQKFPLTVEEALQIAGQGERFPIHKIRRQIASLEEDPVDMIYGQMDWTIPKKLAHFSPTSSGKLVLLEYPKKGSKYVIGLDAYDLKQKNLGSSGAAWLWKLRNVHIAPLEEEKLIHQYFEAQTNKERLNIHLQLGGLPVGLFIERYPDPKKFADVVAALAIWAWRMSGIQEPVKILPETQPGLILDYLLLHHKELVMNSPMRSGQKLTIDFLKNQFGVKMDDYWADMRLAETIHFLQHNCEMIYFREFLQHCLEYDETVTARKYDEVDAFGITRILVADERIKQWRDKKMMDRDDSEEFYWNSFRRDGATPRHRYEESGMIWP